MCANGAEGGFPAGFTGFGPAGAAVPRFARRKGPRGNLHAHLLGVFIVVCCCLVREGDLCFSVNFVG